MFRRLLLWSIIPFYFLMGANHFIHPEFFHKILPPYIPWPGTMIALAGLFEFALGFLFLFAQTRKLASLLTVIMLFCYLPVHIYFVQMSSCLGPDVCVEPWLGWLRLVIVQPLLMAWAWAVKEL